MSTHKLFHLLLLAPLTACSAETETPAVKPPASGSAEVSATSAPASGGLGEPDGFDDSPGAAKSSAAAPASGLGFPDLPEGESGQTVDGTDAQALIEAEQPDATLPPPHLGVAISEAALAPQNLNIFPDGKGLPPGRGTVGEGARLFAKLCAGCHGEAGRGGSADELAGGRAPLTSETPDKNIGTYWPYATTLFDFLRRSMPMHAPQSLEPDELYALAAYLLQQNGIIGEHEEMNAATLPQVIMPNREGFQRIDTP